MRTTEERGHLQGLSILTEEDLVTDANVRRLAQGIRSTVQHGTA